MAKKVTMNLRIKIYLDWPIARRLRRHLLDHGEDQDIEHFPRLDILLKKLYDEGTTECIVAGEDHQFNLNWSLVRVPEGEDDG